MIIIEYKKAREDNYINDFVFFVVVTCGYLGSNTGEKNNCEK